MDPTDEMVPLWYGEVVPWQGSNKPGAEMSKSVEILSMVLIEERRWTLGVDAV